MTIVFGGGYISQEEKDLINHAGIDYRQPREIKVAELDIFDGEKRDIDEFIKMLVDFKKQNPGAEIICRFDNDYDDGKSGSIIAKRLETDIEIQQRIEGYKRSLRESAYQRKLKYEELKKEFGGK